MRSPIGIRPVAPIISVRRNEPGGPGILPPRDGGHPIQIGGVTAQPLRPVAVPREGFNRTPGTAGPVTSPVRTFNPGGIPGGPLVPGVRTGYAAPPVTGAPRPVYAPVQRPGYTPTQPGHAPVQPGGVPMPGYPTAPRAPSVPVYRPAPVYVPAPAPRPSGGGGSVPRSAPAPAPHPSGGGGGSHVTSSPHK
jgi:hypothetical protein